MGVGVCADIYLSTPIPTRPKNRDRANTTHAPARLARELLGADVQHPDHQELAHDGEGERLDEKDPGGPEEELDGPTGPVFGGG